VPAPGSILVRYDPVLLTREKIVTAVGDALAGRAGRLALAPSSAETRVVPPSDKRRHLVSVFYGWRDGPDLREVADRLGLAPQEVIARHVSGKYTVISTGFAPGFVYLGGLEPGLHIERRDEPRRSVPAGSVAIGGSQTGIYGLRSPGGWWLIGRTSLHTFDITRTPPSDFVIGDEVSFMVDPGGVTTEVHEAGGMLRGHRPWVEGA